MKDFETIRLTKHIFVGEHQTDTDHEVESHNIYNFQFLLVKDDAGQELLPVIQSHWRQCARLLSCAEKRAGFDIVISSSGHRRAG